MLVSAMSSVHWRLPGLVKKEKVKKEKDDDKHGCFVLNLVLLDIENQFRKEKKWNVL